MQIVKVMGGLGNQMFSYAFALALRKLGREVALDTSSYERYPAHNGWELGRLFKLDIPQCAEEDRDRLGDVAGDFGSRLRRKVLGPRRGHVLQRGPGYDRRFADIPGDAYFDGYWQSWRYHEDIDSEIDATFKFPPELESEGKACLEAAGGRTVIGVHVRRGDYLESEDLGGVCDEGYYARAIESLSPGTADPLLLFFSDDLDWCRERLGKGRESVYVDWNRRADSWRDMRLMTFCDGLAISNSSFGWWGARLGAKRGRKIAAPSRWFGGRHPDNLDIVLPGWTRVAARQGT
jgi:hypothetical protein